MLVSLSSVSNVWLLYLLVILEFHFSAVHAMPRRVLLLAHPHRGYSFVRAAGPQSTATHIRWLLREALGNIQQSIVVIV